MKKGGLCFVLFMVLGLVGCSASNSFSKLASIANSDGGSTTGTTTTGTTGSGGTGTSGTSPTGGGTTGSGGTGGGTSPTGGGTGGTSGSGGTGTGGSTPPTGPVVCDPFSTVDTSTQGLQNGVKASLTYLPSSSTPVTQYLDGKAGLSVSAFMPGAPSVQLESRQIFLSQINVPTENFSDGFKDSSGNLLTDNTGQTLVEYFSLHLDGDIQLNTGDREGNYQLALLSDDGSLMYLAPNGVNTALQTTPWINNDSVHGNNLGCSNQSVNLSTGVAVPFHIDYFQGPRWSIALVLLWRYNPQAADLAGDSPCGITAYDDYFFDPTAIPSAPYAPWTSLTSNFMSASRVAGSGTGWQVVPAANLYLQNGAVNPCTTSTSGSTTATGSIRSK